MIVYAYSRKSGARKLSYKYNLRYVPAREYITEKNLKQYGAVIDRDSLLDALQSHQTVHAFVLPNLSIYFHPDTAVPVIASAFRKYFSSLV